MSIVHPIPISSRTFAALITVTWIMNISGCAPNDGTSDASSQSGSKAEFASLPMAKPRALDLQGHRGMRAHWPENSILGMVEAVIAGVTTLEMDVVIASDGQPILSHEPWLNAEICRTPAGQPIAHGDHSWNLYEMSMEDLAKCDCGGQGHPRFPLQRPVATPKPTLSALLETLEARATSDPRFAAVRFNIELKHRPEGDGLFHPDAETFATSVISVIDRHGIAARTTLQSFSASALEAVHDARPDLSTAWLVEEEGSTASWLDFLTFTPSILSPAHHLLTQQDIEDAHERGLRVIPWTVNDASDAEALIRMGVDGIITDDPHLLTPVIESQGCTVAHFTP
jgi:glycerophosphoryl diester phosphodiesterase